MAPAVFEVTDGSCVDLRQPRQVVLDEHLAQAQVRQA
jgi:hypothetical protein